MTKILTGIAALMIVGATALPVPASAVEQGVTKAQSTDLSSQRRWHRPYYGRHWGYRHWGPRYGYRHWGPRYYGYRHWGPRYRYGYYPHRYRHYGYYGYPYYRRPGLAFGVGPLGIRVF
ncbi:MAG: hypothetical protein WDO17_02510 [Alphaproteobacteria bacterium]